QNNPQASRHLATCPFNARHRVPRNHLRSHLSSCPDKRLLDASQGTLCPPQGRLCPQVCPGVARPLSLTAVLSVPADTEGMPWSTSGMHPEPPEPWQPPPCRENWDAGEGPRRFLVVPAVSPPPGWHDPVLSPRAELDALEELPPFILNVTSWDLPTPCDRYDPRGP
ncbi:GTSF1 factor, partial [Sclerurus mexicanus]|nr:GTSF1 factor [Sclerurus mexicanus]